MHPEWWTPEFRVVVQKAREAQRALDRIRDWLDAGGDPDEPMDADALEPR